MQSAREPHPRIVFTGGGSAGHVIPNLALIAESMSLKWDVSYIGSYNGIERDLIQDKHITYYAINTGKLRRYFSWQNFVDPFKILAGMWQAWRLLGRLKPKVVFSKGGFVAFPVVFAAWLRRIPVIAHESDFTPGLANRWSYRYAKRICVSFEETRKKFPDPTNVVHTGAPIRSELLQGVRTQGLDFCRFTADKPVILIMAGGSGSVAINKTIRESLPQLLENFQVIHICGAGNLDPKLVELGGYQQYAYIDAEMPHVLACADLVISRAGANTVFELLVLQKPHILIPLTLGASRGDQIENAKYFSNKNLSVLLAQDDMTAQSLLGALNNLWKHAAEFKKRIAASNIKEGTAAVMTELKAYMPQLDEKLPPVRDLG